MTKKPNLAKKSPPRTPASRPKAVPQSPIDPLHADFDVVLGFIDAARARAIAAVNTTLIDLYRSIGEFISVKIASDGWGKGTVAALAEAIRRRYPNSRGYSAQNLWRMRQFFESYRDQPKLSALLRELNWTNNMMILGKCKREEEREFYLRIAATQRWPTRELERQINGALFE
jgi:predicted nuclease of restriction endonuclease-like (RecB) superfamily